jgi:hypothetical protein
MAAILQTTVLSSDTAVNVTRTTMTASDTIPYVQGAGQVLVLYNTTASPVTVTMLGSAATTVSIPGMGGAINVAAGKTVQVPATGTTVVQLDDYSNFLSGNVTITGGTGLVAHLFV